VTERYAAMVLEAADRLALEQGGGELLALACAVARGEAPVRELAERLEPPRVIVLPSARRRIALG
jgi:hypothetical protein